MATKKVLVRIPKLDGVPLYRRAGFTFSRGVDNIVEADEKQIAILRADPLIAVGEPLKEEQSQQNQQQGKR